MLVCVVGISLRAIYSTIDDIRFYIELAYDWYDGDMPAGDIALIVHNLLSGIFNILIYAEITAFLFPNKGTIAKK